MANTNYIGSMDSPYGNFRPNGFLAGMMYPDMMQDYRTRRDLQNRGLGISNDMASAQLDTYQADSPVRGAQRQKTLADLAFEEKMRGANESIKEQTTLADLNRLPIELQTKLVEALYNKDAKNFQKNSQLLMQIQALISPFGDITDENYDTIVALAERAGMDMTRYWDYADEFTPADTGNLTGEPIGDGDAPRGTEGVIAPTVNVAAPTKKTKKQLMQELNFLRRLNPEVFKFDNDMTKERYTQEQQNQRQLQQLSSAERIAAMQKNASSAATTASMKPYNMAVAAKAEWYRVNKDKLPPGMTPEAQAALDVFQFQTTGRTEAANQGRAQQARKTIDELEGRSPGYSVDANINRPPEDLVPNPDMAVGKDVTIGGKTYKVVRIDPDGVPVVNVNGQLRRLRPKGKQ